MRLPRRIRQKGPVKIVYAKGFQSQQPSKAYRPITCIPGAARRSVSPTSRRPRTTTTKAAVNKVGQILALDLKDAGIASAVIHPGYVKTDMGGPNAEITPEESASGIRSVIDGLNMDSTGGFFKWNGEVHAW